MSKTALSILLVLATSCSCSRPRRESPDRASLRAIPVVDAERTIETLLAERGTLLFRSRSGKLYGMDSDTDVLISTNHQAQLIQYGYTVTKYAGTYSVDDDGQIALDLAKYRRKWPVMRLSTAQGDFYLQTASGSTHFIMGDRAGATETPSMAPFWPFKLIKKDAEAK
jgi:hypothetical protein